MGLPFYLAVTDWEYQNCPQLPAQLGWMACNFSSSGNGLRNIPSQLPEKALLLVSDQIPPQRHDPSLVAEQLCEAVSKLDAAGVVLDFQRPYNEEAAQMAMHIQDTLPCPVSVTVPYLQNWKGAVFLPPVPVDMPLEDHLQPYDSREIWLEADIMGEVLTLTDKGCFRQPLSDPCPTPAFQDDALCCHYQIELLEDRAVFSLWRTRQDLDSLLSKAQGSGVRLAIGLYQQFY